MPGFISHTVMAKDVYKRIKNKQVNKDYMVTYSLGGDLCKYAKCRYDSHHKDQDKFIYNMADYLKRNNLVNDSECLGVLYGHICHYIMDDIIHPLVRKVDKTCLKNKKNHSLIEEYYDSYLVEKVFNKTKKEYVKNNILKAKVDKKVSKMIDYAYLVTYDVKKVSRFYKFNKFLYQLLRNVYKLFNTKTIEKISGLKNFLLNNRNIDLFNDNNKIIYKDYVKEESDDSLITLYEDSVLIASNYIEKIDEYLLKGDNDV